MKTALVHDWLTLLGGGEHVLQSMYELYPSPIYTLVTDEKNLAGTFWEGKHIESTFIKDLPFARKNYRRYLPLFPLATEQIDLTDYQLILSSSAAFTKNVLSNPSQLHVCYCHSPIRYAWDLYFLYLKEANLTSGLSSYLARLILHYIRLWDYASHARADYLIANSQYIAKRIKKLYGRDSSVIYPPVDLHSFTVKTTKDDYYLTASRMVPYKRIPLIAESFSTMPNRKLVIAGDGPEMARLKKIAGGCPNIELVGYQSRSALIELMRNAKAFVFAAEEDFGIIPVEAQACGTPVIAYGKGGTLETIKDGITGLFFEKQEVECIKSAIDNFEKISDSLDPNQIRAHAESFSKDRFKKEYKDFVEKSCANHFG